MNTMWKKLRTLLLVALLALGGATAVTMTGCQDEGPVEEATEEAEDAGEEMQEEAEDATDEMQDQAEDMTQ